MNIQEQFKNIELNKSLKELTTFKVGGSAKYFLEILNINELQVCIKYCNKNSIDFLILGGGSNILISDNGFPGLVIKIKSQGIELENNIFTVSAGVMLNNFLQFTLDKGYVGAEFLAGIPGTMGGAIYGNAGAYNKSICDIVNSVLCVTRGGEIVEMEKQDCKFDYRNSVFKQNKYIIFSTRIFLERGDVENSKQIIKKSIEDRNSKQPLEYPNAGSFFKNIKLTNEIRNNLRNLDISIFEKSGVIPAGFLIEKAGLKGLKVGGASVSEKHANFLINYDRSMAIDIYNLSKKIQEIIFEKYKINLEPEVQFIGEFEV
ncbi:MAG TPA: UDP-N-acetylmuramate dehydrogenase [bacterium]|jgi:UDP-N-acetylmuramate dehydrogenase|nr:UDP-N-acetylmuramate dehydrogenase [bacterium]HOG38219.1 UDP-N-acetylmuramate dehydrogenase [bacterium]HQI03191.1 UDP-N-acetylmuramate dehydrogenase [bacterium]